MQRNLFLPARMNADTQHILVKIVTEMPNVIDPAKPYLFILPSQPGFGHSYCRAYEKLTKFANLVFHDPRGSGQSPASVTEQCTIENHVDDIESIRRHLGVEKIILAGKFYGGICALAYALKYPNAVSKLIVTASAPSHHVLESAKKYLHQHGSSDEKALAEKLWQGQFKDEKEVSELFDSIKLFSKRLQEWDPLIPPKPDLPASFSVLNFVYQKFMHTFNLTDQLPHVHAHTLIIVGHNDWFANPDHSKTMARKIPHSRLVVIPHAGHDVEIDAPDAYFKTIVQFIQHGFQHELGLRLWDENTHHAPHPHKDDKDDKDEIHKVQARL